MDAPRHNLSVAPSSKKCWICYFSPHIPHINVLSPCSSHVYALFLKEQIKERHIQYSPYRGANPGLGVLPTYGVKFFRKTASDQKYFSPHFNLAMANIQCTMHMMALQNSVVTSLLTRLISEVKYLLTRSVL